MSFNESEYFLHPRGKVGGGVGVFSSAATADNAEFFDHASFFDHVTITREDEDADVTLAVEGFLDTEDPHICDGPLQHPNLDVETCLPLLIGIRQQDGGLFLRRSPTGGFRYHYTSDYPMRRMEISAEDESSGFKAYYEVIIRPPVVSPACDDFTDRDINRMVCRFLDDRPIADLPTTTASLRNGLPGLVQPKDNYDLIFAEEFNQNIADTAAGCTDGMNLLDSSIWNHRGQGCDQVDVNGQSCENVEGGSLVMSFFKDTDGKTCRAHMHTFGKFSFKYGYWEVKYTLVGNGTSQTGWHDYTMSLGGSKLELRTIAAAYDLSIDDYESITTLVGTGVKMYEITPTTRQDIGHQFLNYNPFVFELDTPPLRSNRKIRYCRTDYEHWNFPTSGCNGAPVTVTKGLEWTPRGYQAFVKVDGVHDELQRFPTSLTQFSTIPPDETSSILYQGDPVEFLDDDRNRFIETYPTHNGTIELEQLGVMHVPMPLWFQVWGWDQRIAAHTMIKLDYIRVFQPRDHYSNMEPHYG